MSTIRVQKQKDYVVINKTAFEDENLSFKAKGIFGYLMSKPDDWNCNVKDLQNNSADGRDSVYAGLKELRKHGYLIKKATRDSKGRYEWEEILYEVPQDEAKELFIQQEKKKLKKQDNESTSSKYGKPEIGENENGKAVNIINTDLLNNYLLSNYSISINSIEFLATLKNIKIEKIEELKNYIDKTNIEFIEIIIDYAKTRKAKTIDYILKIIKTKIDENIITVAAFIESIQEHKSKKEDTAKKVKEVLEKKSNLEINDIDLEQANIFSSTLDKVDITNAKDISYELKELLNDEEISEVSFKTWIKPIEVYLKNDALILIVANEFNKNIILKKYLNKIRKIIMTKFKYNSIEIAC